MTKEEKEQLIDAISELEGKAFDQGATEYSDETSDLEGEYAANQSQLAREKVLELIELIFQKEDANG